MSHFKADAYLTRIFSVNLLTGYDNKSGGIVFRGVDTLFQNVQSVNFSSKFTCDGRLCLIAVFCAAKALFGMEICFQSCSSRYLADCISDWGCE